MKLKIFKAGRDVFLRFKESLPDFEVGDEGDEPTGMYGNEGTAFSRGALVGVDVTNPVSTQK